MDRRTLTVRLGCVALAVCVIVPLARFVFPIAVGEIGTIPFNAIEAVVTTSIGFGLYSLLFG
jgi:hypothetical protein